MGGPSLGGMGQGVASGVRPGGQPHRSQRVCGKSEYCIAGNFVWWKFWDI